VELDDAGPAAQEQGQHPGGERVERATVADALGCRKPTHEADHVV
jgi:hypothetical protein